MQHKTVTAGPFSENCYILRSDEDRSALIIDPGHPTPEIEAALTGFAPRAILLTHGHLDHIGAVEQLRQNYDIPVFAPQLDERLIEHLPEACRMFGLPVYDQPHISHWIKPGQTMLTSGDDLQLPSDLTVTIRHTPGHSPGGVCYRLGTQIFTGDTLFYQSIGRTDLPGGDYDLLMQSLALLMQTDTDLEVLPGHGAATSLFSEKLTNPFLTQFLRESANA